MEVWLDAFQADAVLVTIAREERHLDSAQGRK